MWVATVARTQKLASNYEQFRPDAYEENVASTLAEDQEEEEKVTVAHAAVVENRIEEQPVSNFQVF